MAEPLFEVVYLGTDLVGDARSKAAEALRILLAIDQENAERVLAANQAFVLRERLTESEARKLQGVLTKLGIRCNYKPGSRSNHSLEIVPIEEEFDGQPLVCPDCGHESHPEPGQAKPEICSRCGLVFAKHEQQLQEQAEREAIRRKLTSAKKAREDERTREAQSEAERARREKLEAELRAELGIPHGFLQSRPKLLGSATALFVVGLVSGILGSRLMTASPSEPAARSPIEAQDAIFASPPLSLKQHQAMAQALANARPNIQLLDMVESTTTSPSPIGVKPSSSAPGSSSGSLHASSGSFGSGQPTALAKRPVTNGRLTGLPVGTKLSGEANAIDAFEPIAERLMASGRQQQVVNLLAEMRLRADALPPGQQRVEALGTLAYLNAEAGQDDASTRLVNQAKDQAQRLASPGERASAAATLGSVLIRMGEEDRGEQLLKAANLEFSGITDTALKLSVASDLAESYALAGQRGTALNLLDFVAKTATSVSEEAERDSVYQRLAAAHARLQDPSGAFAAIDRISKPMLQDGALQAAATELVKSGHVLWAADMVEHIRAPQIAAPAFALLGEAYAGQAESEQESLQAFARAESTARLIGEPLEKVRALAEVGQAYQAAGKQEPASQSFDGALKIARSLSGSQMGEALGAIATSELDALLLVKSLETANEIADPALKAKILSEIEGARRIAVFMEGGPS